MDKNLKNCSSYSDLFEDFFRADAGQEVVTGSNNTAVSVVNELDNINMFNTFTNVNNNPVNNSSEQQQIVQLSDFAQIPTDQAAIDFYMQQQAAFYQTAAYSYAPAAASVHKPGFVRNRTRKNARQKSVASAVRVSHMLNLQQQQQQGQQIVNAPSQFNSLNEYHLMYQQAQMQQTQMSNQMYVQQIPYYQAAAQIPTYQQQQQQAVLMAKSPMAQQPLPFMRNSFPASPSARSPNSNSSDYVKMKLQQKIRSRMVSKGQIPPNPTEEELRMCGVQISQQQMVTPSQLPTPKSSPQQIPRAFNNNAAAFIAAPSMMIPNQIQQDLMVQDDLMKYFEMNPSACYSQKDPLSITNPSTELKQQENDFNQQDSSGVTVNYDQFFSDFILY